MDARAVFKRQMTVLLIYGPRCERGGSTTKLVYCNGFAMQGFGPVRRMSMLAHGPRNTFCLEQRNTSPSQCF